MGRNDYIAIVVIVGLCAAINFLAPAGEQTPGVNLAWRLLNIAVFVGILYKFVGKRAADFFTGRREGIRADLADLESRKQEAENKLGEIRRSIADLDAQRKAILDESREQAEQLKAVILAEARKQAELIREQALRAAENERKAAIEDLRAVLADEIASATEALLQSKLDEAMHDKLINNSLTKVVLN